MPQRVLIVDDDEALRESLALVLGAEGYETSLARDGADALARIDDTMPDIVLCDLRMPGIDGLALLPELSRRRPDATLILMSAYGTEQLALEAGHVRARRGIAHRNHHESALVRRSIQELSQEPHGAGRVRERAQAREVERREEHSDRDPD